MENKTEIIQIILNGFKFDGHGNLAIKNLMKKYLLSGVSTQYKDLSKFAHGLDSLLFREKLEEPLKKKAKRRHYSLLSPITRKLYGHGKSKSDRPAKNP